MLSVSNLKVNVNGAPKLLGVDLEVREGETVGVLGPNGVGKSTLMRTIVGLLRPVEGQIAFRGQKITPHPHELARRGLVLAPQNYPIFPSLSVEEHLNLGVRSVEERERVLELFPELESHLERSASGLSGGQRQMLSIAQALMMQPELLLLDEPSSGLAPKVVRTIFKVISDIASSGISILLVEQNTRMALQVTDRAVVLEGGKIVLEGSSSEIGADPHVRKAYLGL